MNCAHCFQNHTDKEVDREYIRNLAPLVLSTMKEEIGKKNPDLVMFSMRGGELFLDSFEDSQIEDYASMILEVKQEFKKLYPDKQLSIHIMSNGVYNKVDRVINFLKTVEGKITLSFDAFGRFYKVEHLDAFSRNYLKFHKEGLIKNIAITLTKEAISQYIKCPELLRKFEDEIDFNYYVPTIKGASLPSDDDLFEFYKTLVDNGYYNCIYVRNLLENHRKGNKIHISCNCANTTVLYHGKAYRTCNIYVPDLDLKDFYGDCEVTEENGVKIITDRGLKKRGCLLCPYFGNCTYYCWMMLCYKGYEMGNCPHREIHKYVEEHPEIMKRYGQWLTL